MPLVPLPADAQLDALPPSGASAPATSANATALSPASSTVSPAGTKLVPLPDDAQLDPVASYGATDALVHGATLGLSDMGRAAIKAGTRYATGQTPNFDYSDAAAEIQRGRDLYAQNHPYISAAVNILGGFAAAPAKVASVAAEAPGFLSSLGKGIVYGGTTGAVQGAADNSTSVGNAARGAAVGGTAGAALGGALSAATGGAARLFAPSADEAAAGGALLRAAPDLTPDSFNSPTELVPGSLPTAAQLTGNPALAGLEVNQRMLDPEPFNARYGDQAAARANVVNNLAPNANSGAVRDLLQNRLQQIDAAGDASVQTAQQQGDLATQVAQQRATAAYDAAGGQGTAADYGAQMRDQLEAAKASAKTDERQLWQAIDPNNNLTINAAPVQQAASDIVSAIPRTAAPMTGEEQAIFNTAQTLGANIPFSDLTALRSRTLDAIRSEAATNGQTQAWRRLQQLRGAMDSGLEDVASGVAQQQASAVASGALDPNLTLEAAMTRQREVWLANRSASSVSAGNPYPGQGFGAYGGSGSAPVSGAFGAGSSAGVGSVRTPTLPGVAGAASPVAPTPLDAEAVARYRAAAAATRQRAQTFNNPIVGPALNERGGMYRMGDTQIPQRFTGTPEGVSAAQNAGISPDTIQHALVSDLRSKATNADGTLNPTKFANWSRQNDAVLRQFPALRQSLNDVAGAQQAVGAVRESANQGVATAAEQAKQATDAFQKGAARHFLNNEDPTRAVGKALGSNNPVEDMRSLAGMVASNPDARAGLQKAVAGHIANTLIHNPDESGVGAMSGAKLNDFLRKNLALKEVMTPDQIGAMNAVAADLRRADMTTAAGKATAKAARAVAENPSWLSRILPGLMKAGATAVGGVIGAHLGEHEIIGALVGQSVERAVEALTHRGIQGPNELLTEALLNPDLAQTLLMKMSPGSAHFFMPRLLHLLDQPVARMEAMQATRMMVPPPATQAQRQAPTVQPQRRAVTAPMLLPPSRLVPGGALPTR